MSVESNAVFEMPGFWKNPIADRDGLKIRVLIYDFSPPLPDNAISADSDPQWTLAHLSYLRPLCFRCLNLSRLPAQLGEPSK